LVCIYAMAYICVIKVINHKQKLIKMTTQIKLQKQLELISLLESFGVTYNRSGIGVESEMQFTKNGAFSLTLSNDVDLKDVFEEASPIEGMIVTNSWSDSGFKTAKFPVRVVTFE
jgi:hypothetical protein